MKVKKVKASQEKAKNDKKEKKVYELPGQKHDPPEMVRKTSSSNFGDC